ncbi:9325_t:CDS:2 [Diversispora eburnea]|uniref:9325_t:CDS:1 n=1 Tax=Diversispora eburnea TaxID=1213867 RepID=A0A9N9B9G6_9GLOM|nr:9325_t:CDS:2 [Diversispora eburnea]
MEKCYFEIEGQATLASEEISPPLPPLPNLNLDLSDIDLDDIDWNNL